MTLAAAAPLARAGGDSNAVPAAVAFRRAFDAWEPGSFEEAARSLEAARNPAQAATYDDLYWLGVIEFHAVLCGSGLYGDPVAKSLPDHVRRAERALESALRLKPDDAECRALLGALTGLQILEHPVTGAWRARRVRELNRAALERGPENPRVHYLVGCGEFHAARLMGSQDRGLARLRRAAELFEREGPDVPRFGGRSWGHSSCLAFIGRIYQDSGETAKALEYYGEALKVTPGDKLAERWRAAMSRSGAAPKR